MKKKPFDWFLITNTGNTNEDDLHLLLSPLVSVCVCALTLNEVIKILQPIQLSVVCIENILDNPRRAVPLSNNNGMEADYHHSSEF